MFARNAWKRVESEASAPFVPKPSSKHTNTLASVPHVRMPDYKLKTKHFVALLCSSRLFLSFLLRPLASSGSGDLERFKSNLCIRMGM
uniref:Uncharacterized protein n=1 Tax=Caenorhabditis japonica TaxID=281687 RepID=A0A8R1IRK9_CAEJA